MPQLNQNRQSRSRPVIHANRRFTVFRVMMACLGTEWMFMSVGYTKQIINMEKQSTNQGKIQFFYVDEEIEVGQ